MRILMVMSTPIPPHEGIGFYVWNLSRYLLGEGHQVQIITRGEWGKPQHEEIEGILVWRPIFLPLYPFHVHLHSIFVHRALKKLDGQYDVVHVHTPLPPLIHTERPMLLTVHAPMAAQTEHIRPSDAWSVLIRAQMLVSIPLERKILASVDKIVSVSTPVANELATYGVNPNDVAVLGNGVDTRIFAAPSLVEEAGAPSLFAAGRLDVLKGFDDLLDAFAFVHKRHYGVKLRIAGMGPAYDRLRTKASGLGLERAIEFLGHVSSRDEMLAYYKSAIAFVHAAHYEGLPTVLLEAMSCGKPVVSTSVGGALDVIEDNVNGLLVPPRDPHALAKRMLEILETPELQIRLGLSARQTIEERFSWDVVGARYLKHYHNLLDGEGA